MKKRNDLGFYSDPPALIGKIGTISLAKSKGFGEGWELKFKSSIEYTEPEVALKIQNIDVHLLHESSSAPIGYMSFVLFSKKPSALWVSQEEFYCECDRISQPLCDFAGAITEFDVEDYLSNDRKLALFDRMEIRPPNDKGRGIKAAKVFLKHLHIRYKVDSVFLKPYPLQYEQCKPSEPEEKRLYEESFTRDRAVLERLYTIYLKARKAFINNDSDLLALDLRETGIKKLQVVLKLEMEIPDNWKLVNHPVGIQAMAIEGGQYMTMTFLPMFTTDFSEGNTNWSSKCSDMFSNKVLGMVRDEYVKMKLIKQS